MQQRTTAGDFPSRKWLHRALLLFSGMAVSAFALAPDGDRPAVGEPPIGVDSASAEVASVVREYSAPAARIRDAAMQSEHAWKLLEQLCDDIGHRLSGSANLKHAVTWAADRMRADGLDVRLQPVEVPKWVRGEESLELLAPRYMRLPMLGLGGSCATPPEGIEGEVVPVRDLDHLSELGPAVAGKIVLFDAPMPTVDEERGGGYGAAVRYRVSGARWALQHGAIATLVRSATTRSLASPHTGAMSYLDSRKQIPAAAIATEHAALMSRLAARNIPIRVRLKMQARMEGFVTSHNVIGELRGRERPEEIVLIGGHLDSWDVGQGAHDDGGGCVAAMAAAALLKQLDLIPRRTIRVVLFTNEENGLAGGRAYAREHEAELGRHVAAIELDSGVFAPRSYSIEHMDPAAQARAADQLRGLLALLRESGFQSVDVGGSGADISPMKPAGVPLMGQDADMTHYFDIHHTHADTLDKVEPRDLARHVAGLAVLAYVLADAPLRLGESPAR